MPRACAGNMACCSRPMTCNMARHAFQIPVSVPLRRQEKAHSEACSGEHGLLQQPCLLWNAHHHIQILDGLPRCSLHQIIDDCIQNISVSSHFGYTSGILLSMILASGDSFGSCIRMPLVVGLLTVPCPSQTYSSQSMQQHPASSEAAWITHLR